MTTAPDVVVHVASTDDCVVECLEALRRHSPESRLIIVEDEPAEETAQWSAAAPAVELLDGMGAGRAAAFNAGLELSESSLVCLMSTRVVVSSGWLKLLEEALGADPRTAAVGPVASGLGSQTLEASYIGLEDFELFAAAYNHSDPDKWSHVLRLSDECLLARRGAIDAVGGFDESYSFGLFAGDDVSIRFVTAGWSLLRCGNVLVHYAGPTPLPASQERFVAMERQGLAARWGFVPDQSLVGNAEIVALVEGRQRLDVLDLGCACGATLLEIANRHPGSALYGIERDEHAAAVAACVATVAIGDVESDLDYPPESFDYVICDGILEQVRDPWRLLAAVRRLLRPGGRVVANVRNVMHLGVVEQLLRGRFHYDDDGVVERSHLRFFTLAEIEELFAGAGFPSRRYSATALQVSDAERRLAETLAESFPPSDRHHLVQQYLIDGYRVLAE